MRRNISSPYETLGERKNVMLPPSSIPSVWPYVVAACATTFVAVLAVVAVIFVRPDKDNTSLITIIVGLVAPTLTAILALIKGNENAASVKELSVKVNGHLRALLEQTERSARLLGRSEGEALAAEKVVVAAAAAEKVVDAATKAAHVAVKVAEVAATTPPIPSIPSGEVPAQVGNNNEEKQS